MKQNENKIKEEKKLEKVTGGEGAFIPIPMANIQPVTEQMVQTTKNKSEGKDKLTRKNAVFSADFKSKIFNIH